MPTLSISPILFSFLVFYFFYSIYSHQPRIWPFYNITQRFLIFCLISICSILSTPVEQPCSLGRNMAGGDRDYPTPVLGWIPVCLKQSGYSLISSAILIGADDPSQRQWSKYLILNIGRKLHEVNHSKILFNPPPTEM